MTKTALILGSHSLVDGGSKVGSQYLAEALVAQGWQVDYVATASSILDIWGRKRHARLKRVWVGGQAQRGVALVPGLIEWAFKALFPAHRLFLRWRWQRGAYSWLVPRRFKQRVYDLCITETTPNMLYLPWVQARKKVFRLSDWPPGFAHDLQQLVIEQMEIGLVNGYFDEVWAVSRPLESYATAMSSLNKVVLLPNGVDAMWPNQVDKTQRQPDTAVYIGGTAPWFDIELLRQAAILLPNWRFDVFGPGSNALAGLPPNLKGHGAVARSEVPSLLARYEVGLIPFSDTDNRMTYVERPLKFYEYVAAGLGVASTDYGALRAGMGNLASFGNSPEAFAQAVLEAKRQAAQRSPEFGREFAHEHGWGAVTKKAGQCLQRLFLVEDRSAA